MANFSTEKISEIRETFQLLDRDNKGHFDMRGLEMTLKSNGLNISKSELKEMFDEVDKNGSGLIEFPEFLDLLAEKMRDTDGEDVLRACFEGLSNDKESTKLDLAELTEFMTTYGDKLSREEMDEYIGSVQVDTQLRVDYEDLIKTLSAK